MAKIALKAIKRRSASTTAKVSLPLRESVKCPFGSLALDTNNPRLQTGAEVSVGDEEAVISELADIAALDELVTSICTNGYLNIEPLIVWSKSGNAPYVVLEGNRRVAAMKLILNPPLAAELGINIPKTSPKILSTFDEVLVYRVAKPEDARDFIGFKHINGPQRWDAYAKAKYVTEWYKEGKGSISIDEIAAKMGDNNNTLRSYIFAVLALEQAERAGAWSLKDRARVRGRFGFSHLYTALQREEYQQYLGLKGGWTDRPSVNPVPSKNVERLGEVLTYLYGSHSADRPSLIKSQNPDLRDIGYALANEPARLTLKNGGSLDDARDAMKSAADAFQDALAATNVRLRRAVELVAKYRGGNSAVDELVSDIFSQAEMLLLFVQSRDAKGKAKNGA